MRLLIVSYERLISNGSAGTAVMCGLAHAALKRGWEVTYLALCKSLTPEGWELPFDFGDEITRLRQAQLLYSRQTNGLRGRFLGSFNHAAISRIHSLQCCPEISEAYDIVVAFDSLAMALSRLVQAQRRISIIGDPAGRKAWHTTSWAHPIRKCKACVLEVLELFFFSRTPREEILAMFGSRHSKYWSRMLGRRVLDLRPFLPSPAVDLETERGTVPIVYFGGTLAGTASRQSFRLIFEEILPALRNRFGTDMFELRIVGDGTDSIRQMSAPHPEIKLLGRVPCFETELAAGDVFILPMNYPVGVRTRICSALAAGNICLVHPSVLVNMPELVQCAAIKAVESPADYASAIADLPKGPALIKLRKAARQFFDGHYSFLAASAPLLDAL